MTRINKFIASLSGISRRSADKLVASGKVLVNGQPANAGYQVDSNDRVTSQDPSFRFDRLGRDKPSKILLMLNKPENYVCSRRGQGSKTIYNLLPERYHGLKPIGRLDKNSSGLLLLTNDGDLANKLAHPRYAKNKTYSVKLDKPLVQKDKNQLTTGVKLDDGLSKFTRLKECSKGIYEVTLAEGRNRQIRRAFAALGYQVIKLNRTKLGDYELNDLKNGEYASL
jgi:23S rRNA pseudouridine2605 synthase